MFKVRRISDGTFLSGYKQFNNIGKIWKTKGSALSAITSQFTKSDSIDNIIFDLEIVEYDLVEKSAKSYLKIATKHARKRIMKNSTPVQIAKYRMKYEDD